MPILIQLGRDKVESRYTLDNLPLTIGRQPDNQICIRDARISRYHGRIEQASGKLTIVDLQSTHHTYVNAQSVDRKELAHGDLISVGHKIDFLYLEKDDPKLIEDVIGRLRASAGGAGGPENSYSGYVNQQMDSLMDELRTTTGDTGVLKKIHEQVTRAVAELKCLYEVGNAINSELDLERVLDLIITHVIRASGAERGFIMLRDPQTLRLVPKVARNMETSLDEVQKTQFSRSIANRAVETKKTVCSMDTRLDPSISTRSVVDYNIRSAICAPLIAKGQVLGVLYVDAKQNLKEFGEKDAEFFTALASQSAIAIENAQLVNNIKATITQLDRKVVELSALYSISQSLLNSSDLESVLETILDKSIETIGSERGSIMLYDDEQECLTVRVIRGKITPGTRDRIKLRRGEGIAGRVAETREGIISNTGYNDPMFKRVSDREQDVSQIMCVPLPRNKDIIGVINLINKTSGTAFSTDDLQLLTSIASQAAVTIENSRLYNLAVFDGLTSVHVRRYFDAWLPKEFERAKRYGNELTLIMVDIDRFKHVNDTYGHQVGDIVLQEVARIIKASIRESDLVARYGGEEFILGLPETNLNGAELFAERLRKRVEDNQIVTQDHVLNVTISLGVCNFRTSDPTTRLDFVRFADRALYQAKGSGRNKYILHHPAMENDPNTKRTTPMNTGAYRLPQT